MDKPFPTTLNIRESQLVLLMAPAPPSLLAVILLPVVLVTSLMPPYARSVGFLYGFLGLAEVKFTRLYTPSVLICCQCGSIQR